MAYEAVTLGTEDGVSLAVWYIPGQEGVIAAPGLMAVVHPHYGGQRATALPWVQVLWREGIPVLVLDGRGHGASSASPPGRGDFVARAADVRAATAELRRRGASRILGVGQSQGAAVLVMGLSNDPDVAGLIVDSGPAPEMGTAAWGLARNMLEESGRDELWTRLILALRILPETRPVHYAHQLWKALLSLRRVPLLWLHGDRDTVIDRRASGCWFRLLAPKDGRWKALRVPGAEHVRTLDGPGGPATSAVRALIALLGTG